VVGIDSLVSLGDLTSSEIDLHLGVRGRGAGLHVEPLFEERVVLVARRGHPALGKRLSRRTLGGLRHVRVDMVPGRNFRDHVAVVYARAGVPRQVAMTVPTFTAAAAVVAASDLVATLPASLLAVQGAQLGLRALVASVSTPRSRWHCVGTSARTPIQPRSRFAPSCDVRCGRPGPSRVRNHLLSTYCWQRLC